MTDTYLHKGLRQKLVRELETKGITNSQVLAAINKVPRHLFLDSSFVHFAYQDKAFPIGEQQTISQPFTVAFQSSLLDIKRGERVLEVGTGSGYQTAVLLELGATVFTIERFKSLSLKAQKQLTALNYRPNFFYGDGYEGLNTYAPFHKILVTAGAPEIPQKLVDQLRPGGRLVIPLGERDKQIMYCLTKSLDNKIEISEHGDFVFVPMLKGKV